MSSKKTQQQIYNDIIDCCLDLLCNNTCIDNLVNYVDKRKNELTDEQLVQYLTTLEITLKEILD